MAIYSKWHMCPCHEPPMTQFQSVHILFGGAERVHMMLQVLVADSMSERKLNISRGSLTGNTMM